MKGAIEGVHDRIRAGQRGGRGRGATMGVEGEAALGCGVRHEAQNAIEGAARTAGPGFAHGAEQRLFNRVPLGRAGGVGTAGNRSPPVFGEGGV